VYRGVLLDLYGTLVHDDEDLLPPICADVAKRAAVSPAAVERVSGSAASIRRLTWPTARPSARWRI
jgi:hypothetical protein